MNIASSKGVGTTVTVTLPILDRERGGVEPHPTNSAPLNVREQIQRAQEASEDLTLARSDVA
jgi:cell cycle sensor histidine kinase DivJ